jgi:hypothetical protein
MLPSTRARIGYASALATGLAIGSIAFGVANAAPARPGAVTHHYSLAASAFAPDSIGDPTHDYFNNWDPTNLSSAQTLRCFNAGLSLPAGATVKSVTFYFRRGNFSDSMEVNRQYLARHTYKVLAQTRTGTATPAVSKHVTKFVRRSDAVIDYGKYAYSAGTCVNGTTRFNGLTVTYTQP